MVTESVTKAGQQAGCNSPVHSAAFCPAQLVDFILGCAGSLLETLGLWGTLVGSKTLKLNVLSAWAAITRCHRLGRLKKQRFTFSQSGGWKSEIRVPAMVGLW